MSNSINKNLLEIFTEHFNTELRRQSAFTQLTNWNERLEAYKRYEEVQKLNGAVDRAVARNMNITRERLFNDILCSYRFHSVIRREIETIETNHRYNRRSARASRAVRRFGWSFLHNAVAHPLTMFGAGWTERFHDWTAEKV